MSGHAWSSDVERDRAVRAAEDAAAQWRRLEVGEVVQEGDEYRTKNGDWLTTTGAGRTVREDSQHYRRRRVPLPDHRDLPQAVAELRERVTRLEAAAKLAPGANAGGEAKQPWPMAFAVWGRGAVCGVSVSREDAGAMQREFAFDTEVRPLYAAPVAESATTPQPPRGWLTEEEREAVKWLSELDQPQYLDAPRKHARVAQALLARSTPPRVKVPKEIAIPHAEGVQMVYDAISVRHAIREAGGEVG